MTGASGTRAWRYRPDCSYRTCTCEGAKWVREIQLLFSMSRDSGRPPAITTMGIRARTAYWATDLAGPVTVNEIREELSGPYPVCSKCQTGRGTRRGARRRQATAEDGYTAQRSYSIASPRPTACSRSPCRTGA